MWLRNSMSHFGSLTLIVMVLACEHPKISTSPTNDGLLDLHVGSFLDSVRDVPAVTLGLPPVTRSFDVNDDSLESTVQERGGLAYVAFKAPNSARALEVRGARAQVPAAAIRSALLALKEVGVEILDFYGSSAMAHVRLPAGAAKSLRHHPLVDFIEPKLDLVPLEQPTVAANSALALSFMHLHQTTQTTAQVTPWNVSSVQAPQAWQYSIGTTARLMLMGLGVRTEPDLPTIPVGNCGGAFNACNSEYFDGPAQAGVIFALNNSIGVVGIAHGIPPARLYSWRIYVNNQPDGNLYLSGINTAASNGIKALFIDFVHSNYLMAIDNALAAAWAAGVVTVGHVGVGLPGQYYGTLYPASFPNVVGVSGARQDGTFAANPTPGCTVQGQPTSSNWGPMVKLAAPFWAYTVFIFQVGSTYADSKTFQNYGYCRTSLSAAHVAAIVALLQDKYPTWSPTQIVQKLTSTASHPWSLDPYVGYGIPNALLAVGPPPPPPLTVSIDGPTQVLSQATCTWLAGPQGGTAPYQYSWTVNGGPAGEDGSLTYTNSGQGFSIGLLVIDAVGANAWTTKFVDILPDAEGCIQ